MSYPATLRGWPAGWPAGVPASDLVWVQAPSGAKWQVHRDIGPILQFIVDEVERRGYLFDHGPADVDDDWGYSNRPIGGTRTASEHSRGIAIDFDAQEYPQHSSKRAPQWIYDLFYQYGFDIGADWGKASRDPMHVEYRGSRTEAKYTVAMLAAGAIRGFPAPMPAEAPKPIRSEEDDMDMMLTVPNVGHYHFRGDRPPAFISGEMKGKQLAQYKIAGEPIFIDENCSRDDARAYGVTGI